MVFAFRSPGSLASLNNSQCSNWMDFPRCRVLVSRVSVRVISWCVIDVEERLAGHSDNVRLELEHFVRLDLEREFCVGPTEHGSAGCTTLAQAEFLLQLFRSCCQSRPGDAAKAVDRLPFYLVSRRLTPILSPSSH